MQNLGFATSNWIVGAIEDEPECAKLLIKNRKLRAPNNTKVGKKKGKRTER